MTSKHFGAKQNETSWNDYIFKNDARKANDVRETQNDFEPVAFNGIIVITLIIYYLSVT